MKSILIKIGFILLELGFSVLVKMFFGKTSKLNLEEFVKSLDGHDLSSDEKYEMAKKYLDDIKEDAPDVIKNALIEAAVLKLEKNQGKILDSIKNKL